MASGIFAILDDVALLLDDAAAMSKVAAKKTAGILGDDLAVNAEKATGFNASRELPVIWAITKGSMVNKLIILPLAFALSAFAPWLIVPILLLGGAYLSYEGAEKVLEWVRQHSEIHREIPAAHCDKPQQLIELERHKIKAALRTDFILSIEIIMIALGTVMDQPFHLQAIVVSAIALLATVGVYGLVGLIVRMDDVGFYLLDKAPFQGGREHLYRAVGQFLVASLPRVIRVLGVVGTLAMLLVGGGMFIHNIEGIHHLLDFMPLLLAELFSGLVVGFLTLLAFVVIKRIRPHLKS